MGIEGKLIGKYDLGIPDRIFMPGFEGTFTAGSGEQLYAVVNNSRVAIARNKDDLALANSQIPRFSASIMDNGLMCVTIYTKKFNSTEPLQNDLFAAKLLKKTVNFFETHNPFFRGIVGEWNDLNDQNCNYRQFLQALPYWWINRPDELTLEQQIAAARKTWTAHQLELLGYSRIPEQEFHWYRKAEKVMLHFYKDENGL